MSTKIEFMHPNTSAHNGLQSSGHGNQNRSELDFQIKTNSSKYILATPELLREILGKEKVKESSSQISVKHSSPSSISAGKRSSELKWTDNTTSHLEHVDVRLSSLEKEYDNKVTSRRNLYDSWKLVGREFAAEFLGTCVLILFGNGVNNQVVLNSSQAVSSAEKGGYLSISFGWGIGTMMGVFVAGGISGGHINPAVTLSLAIFRKFSWKKVLPYWLAQVSGAYLGSVLVQLMYSSALDLFEGSKGLRTVLGARSTAALFFTAPADYMSDVNCFFQEFLNTAILLLVILAINDRHNSPVPSGMNPFILLWLIVGLGASLGSQTAYAVNPARDFGPRLMAASFGYGKDVWTFRHQYWLWTPWIATCSGGIVGSLIYDFFIYAGSDSPLGSKLRKVEKNEDLESGTSSSVIQETSVDHK